MPSKLNCAYYEDEEDDEMPGNNSCNRVVYSKKEYEDEVSHESGGSVRNLRYILAGSTPDQKCSMHRE